MDEAEAVRRGEPSEDLPREVDRLGERDGAARHELLFQRVALEPLHHEVRAAFGREAEIGHHHEVRVREPRERLRLDPHALDLLRLPREVFVQQLDDDGLAERDVLRVDDLAHAAAT